MIQDESSGKEKIFRAALELVTEGKSDQQITMREIASKAGVNLALINYHYQSKENLLSQVVGTMMGGIIEQYNHNITINTNAQTKLRNILVSTANAAFKYRNISKITISIELKSGCQNSCKLVTPLLKEIFTERNDADLNIIAMQLMVPFHHIVLNPVFYNRYLDTDFFDEIKREQKINQMIDCVLVAQEKEEE